MCPPILLTLYPSPYVLDNGTLCVVPTCNDDIGFLYGKLIFYNYKPTELPLKYRGKLLSNSKAELGNVVYTLYVTFPMVGPT